MEQKEQKQFIIVHGGRKHGRCVRTLDVVREEYADYIRRVLHHAGLLGYPPQAVANDILIMGAQEKHLEP